MLRTFFILEDRDWLYNIKEITYQHGRSRHIHRNGWRIGRRSSCRNRSCPPCYQTVCPPKTLCTCCRGSRLHASACPYTTNPENDILITLIFFFLIYIYFQFIFHITSVIIENQLLLLCNTVSSNVFDLKKLFVFKVI